MSLRVAFVAEGDAGTADCWSGSGRRFVEALRATGIRVDIYDAELRSWPKAAAAALTYHPVRGRWRQRYGLGALPFHVRSARVSSAIARAGVDYDAVVQIGATFAVRHSAVRGARYVIYCDSNIAYARSGAPYSSASRLQPGELLAVQRREQQVYDAADRIWTMSRDLARSFQDDFQQPPAKLRTIYSGANNQPTPVRGGGSPPMILFVGKDHARKGSAILLPAFERVREVFSNAELHLVGGVPPNADRPGVIAHGVLSRATPEGREILDRLFGSATVFCMPSRYEPFGIVFVEAMLAGLACVGTRRWAMPEIISEGETGWLVTDGSIEELSRVLIEALSDPQRCARMGALGRERSLAMFTWDRVAVQAAEDLGMLCDKPLDRSLAPPAA